MWKTHASSALAVELHLFCFKSSIYVCCSLVSVAHCYHILQNCITGARAIVSVSINHVNLRSLTNSNITKPEQSTTKLELGCPGNNSKDYSPNQYMYSSIQVSAKIANAWETRLLTMKNSLFVTRSLPESVLKISSAKWYPFHSPRINVLISMNIFVLLSSQRRVYVWAWAVMSTSRSTQSRLQWSMSLGHPASPAPLPPRPSAHLTAAHQRRHSTRRLLSSHPAGWRPLWLRLRQLPWCRRRNPVGELCHLPRWVWGKMHGSASSSLHSWEGQTAHQLSQWWALRTGPTAIFLTVILLD